MFDEIVGSGVENYTNFAVSVHTAPKTHNNVIANPQLVNKQC